MANGLGATDIKARRCRRDSSSIVNNIATTTPPAWGGFRAGQARNDGYYWPTSPACLNNMVAEARIRSTPTSSSSRLKCAVGGLSPPCSRTGRAARMSALPRMYSWMRRTKATSRPRRERRTGSGAKREANWESLTPGSSTSVTDRESTIPSCQPVRATAHSRITTACASPATRPTTPRSSCDSYDRHEYLLARSAQGR